MTLHFPDVSHYQSGLSLHGAPAVIAKASEGSSVRDAAFNNFRNQARILGIPFVAYHWVDTSDLDAQARNIVGAAGTDPVMWDAEAAGSSVSRLVALTTKLRALGGNPRLVYLPHWWWQNHLGSPDLRPLAKAGLSLISSQYTTYSDTGPGWAPYGGMAPVIWQYSDNHAFNGQRVDFNAFKGTVDELRVLLGTAPPAVGGDDMTPLQEAKLSDCLNILTGIANGVDSVPVHDKDGVLSLAPLYKRIAEEVAKLPAGGLDPAAIAKAVNDDAARRMAQ